MTADPRAALATLVSARAAPGGLGIRRGEDDPTVLAAYEDLADAFEAYDEALLTNFGEMTPLELYDDADEEEIDPPTRMVTARSTRGSTTATTTRTTRARTTRARTTRAKTTTGGEPVAGCPPRPARSLPAWTAHSAGSRCDVRDVGQSADWLASECGVGSVVIVEVDPAR